MHIQQITERYRNDIYCTMNCRHCGYTRREVAGYDDHHYHHNVVPAIHCWECGKNEAGEERTEQVVEAARAKGVNI